MARIDWHPRPSAAIWTSEPCGPAFAEVVENVFRPLVAYHLAASGGALVHSCAVEVAGRCAILFGHADAGKSTIARLALERGMRILSDDLNAIVCAGGEWIVRAMPFAGEHRGGDNGESIPLGALFKIVKSTENRVNSLRPAEGLASLFACAPYVNIDPHRGQALEATLASMVTSVSLGVLEFHRDGGFWPLLESAGGSLAEARDRHGRR
jgi:hypothetical protein